MLLDFKKRKFMMICFIRYGGAGLSRFLSWSKGIMALLYPQRKPVRKGLGDDDDAQRRMIMADIETPAGSLTVMNGYFPR